MFQNRGAVAWIVLLLAFFGCALITFAVPTTANWYLARALKVDVAQLEVINGTAIIQRKGSTQETATTGLAMVGEGDTMRTVPGSQAMVWLPGGNNVRLWPATALAIGQLRSSQYNNNDSLIQLRQESGHTRVEVALPVTKNRSLQVVTPDGTITFREGSFSLDLQPGRSELVTHRGSASLEAGGRSVAVLPEQRSVVVRGEQPQSPMPSAANLLANGDFTRGVEQWQAGNREEEEPIPGSVKPVVDGSLPAVRFLRTQATKHLETYLVQNVNRDVTDFRSLKIGLDLKLVQQSLSGGGWLGSEYPLTIRVKYRDVWGSEAIFRRGFYFQNVDNHPTSQGELVDGNVWMKRGDYDLFDRATTDPRPAYIISVELAASGWSYESLATNVHLVAE